MLETAKATSSYKWGHQKVPDYPAFLTPPGFFVISMTGHSHIWPCIWDRGHSTHKPEEMKE